MLETIRQDLKNKFNDDKLVENLFFSFQKISEEYIAQKPVDLLQNTGLFVESAIRIAEHLIFGTHTPICKSLDLDKCIKTLEKATGSDGLRIHLTRLGRSIYDFRTRKKAVHLKFVDPQAIDANLVFNIINWIMIEILKESEVADAEGAIRILFTRKIPLVQEADGILRTTNPKLLGTQRILLLLYSAPAGLSEEELFEGTKRKIKNKNHLQKNLKNMDNNDLIHQRSDNKWILFGQGFVEAEKIITKFT